MGNSVERQQLERARLTLVAGDRSPLGAARRGEHEETELETSSPDRPTWLGRLRREHIAAVVGLLLVGVLIAVYFLSRSSVTELPLAQEPVVVASSPSAPSSQAPPLRVHVMGAVAQPGVVSVPAGAIVQDALEAAGGLDEDADPGELNLAAAVVDGQQIIVGTIDAPRGEVLGATAQGSSGTLLNLNAATAEQLQELPGVGPVLAEAIISWREENGPFKDVSQLDEVSGIGPKVYERLAPLVTV